MSLLSSIKQKWSRLREVFVPNLLFLLGRGPKRLEDVWPDRGQSCLRSVPLTLPSHYDYDLQVIVPVYNTSRYLRQCLDSLLSQQLSYRICVVCVNDGSTDDSGKILVDYAARYPHLYVLTQENQGVSSARNHAISLMLAPRLFFLDSDDLLVPGALQKLMDQSIRTGADFTEGGICQFDDNGLCSNPRTHSVSDHSQELMGFACNKIVRLDVFRQVQFPVGYLFEDTVYSMLLFWQFPHHATVDGVTYQYRVNNSGSLSTTRHLRLVDSYWVTCRIFEDYLCDGGVLTDAYRENLKKEMSNVIHTVTPLRRLDINALLRPLVQSFLQKYCS